MSKVLKKGITLDQIWFCLLLAYIATGYFANDVLLPSAISSLTLYAFLGFSVLMVIANGKIKKSPIITWEIVCLILAFVAMLYSPEFSIFGGTYYSLIVNFILVFILAQMDIDQKRLDTVFSTYTFSGAALVAILFVTGNLSDESGRLGQELTGNANILAMMLMVSSIYGLWMCIMSKKASHRIAHIIAVAVIYIGMFLSGGRKYIVVPIVFLFIVLMYKTDSNGRKHALKYTLIVGVSAIAVYLLIMKVPVFYQSIGQRFEGAFALFEDGNEVDSSTDIRMTMIEGAFEKWLSSPIWGYGFDSFKFFNRDVLTGKFYYSHNNFTELLYNQGLIGFAAYYAFYFYLCYTSVKKCSNASNKGFVIGTIVAILLFEYFGITYSTTPTQFLLFFCLIILQMDIKANQSVSAS